VPEGAAGKKVRCPGCKEIVAVPTRRPAPARRRETARADDRESDDPSDDDIKGPRTTRMRCAACKAAALRALPANSFSRHPGYACSRCGAVMRPPGSTAMYVITTVLGGCMCLLGLVLCVVVLLAATVNMRLLSGMITLVALGAAVAGWSVKQLWLPIPLDAPARPTRVWLGLGVFLVVLVLVLLVAGGALFCLMYFLHEM
jgi:hypothetical protein